MCIPMDVTPAFSPHHYSPQSFKCESHTRLARLHAAHRCDFVNAARSGGKNKKLATSVSHRLITRRSPMLVVPGCRNNAREPKAVPVVSAENRTALAIADANTAPSPARQFI